MLDVLESNEILVLGFVRGSTPTWRPVAPLGSNPRNGNEFAVFDLCFEPREFLGRSVEDLIEGLNSRSSGIKMILLNRQPIILKFAEYEQADGEF